MTILRYILLFFFYSAAGWALESTYRSIGEKRLINSGFLTGPMCPIYGTGALFMTVLLYNPFKDRPLIVFLLGMVVCDIVEYVTSLLMEILFNQHWWNYQYEFGNLNGRICLKHTLYWGVGSVGFVYLIHPGVDKIVSGFSDKTVIILICACFVVFLADCVHSFIKALDVRALEGKIKSVYGKIKPIISPAIEAIEEGAEKVSNAREKTNDNINISRQELFDQVSELIERLEAFFAPEKEKDKRTKRSSRYLRASKVIQENFVTQLERLKKAKAQIKEKLDEISDDKKE